MCFKKKPKENVGWYSPAKFKKKLSIKAKVSIIIASVLLLAFLLWWLAPAIISEIINSPWEPFEADDKDIIIERAPVNSEMSDAIDNTAPLKDGETWAIYIYFTGSDLEDCEMNELSELTSYLIRDEVQEISSTNASIQLKRLDTFVSDVTATGMDLPQVLYRAKSYTPSYGSSESSQGINPDDEGCASANINSITSTDCPENLQIVMQTGGARRWQNAMINPNRSQRFLANSSGFKKVYDEPLVNMGEASSLADFLKFCNRNYSADHTMVIIWDHGSGINGCCFDEIYGDHLTLNEIRDAFSGAVQKNINDPYYDIIAFDCCLLATDELCFKLNGYGKYLLASQEDIPGSGFPYSDIISGLADNPAMNPAQLGKSICDTYIENNIVEHADTGYDPALTLSLVDIGEGAKAYELYGDFCNAALKKIADDPSSLGELCKAAKLSIAYGGSDYNYFNEIDFRIFMEESESFLPSEANKVIGTIDKAVVYTRNSGYLKESHGLSIYFPATINTCKGLLTFLEFGENVCEIDSIYAIYYYKIAGCLNSTLNNAAGVSLSSINYSILGMITERGIGFDGNGNLFLNLTSREISLLQDVRFALVYHDPDTDDLIYYGEDAYAYFTDGNSVETNYKGTWITFGGEMLPLEPVSKTGDTAIYRTRIDYNGYDAWLITGYNAETDEVSVLGVRVEFDGDAVLDRSLIPLKDKDIITIKYETGNLHSNVQGESEETVIYREGKTKLEELPLPDGNYYEYLVFEDLRSDIYYSQIVSFDIRGGTISGQKVEENLISYDKE